jgi:hypothetical protein
MCQYSAVWPPACSTAVSHFCLLCPSFFCVLQRCSCSWGRAWWALQAVRYALGGRCWLGAWVACTSRLRVQLHGMRLNISYDEVCRAIPVFSCLGRPLV